MDYQLAISDICEGAKKMAETAADIGKEDFSSGDGPNDKAIALHCLTLAQQTWATALAHTAHLQQGAAQQMFMANTLAEIKAAMEKKDVDDAEAPAGES